MSYSRQVIGAFCHCPSARRTEERNKYGKRDKKMKKKENQDLKIKLNEKQLSIS
jgi:hypothetical protein